jgi:WXG100 family type VII secretion target
MSGSVDFKMNYEMMEQMSRVFRQCVERMQDTVSEMLTIADSMEDGVLVGEAGTAFCDGLRGRLVPSINRLGEKFDELSRDIDGAVRKTRDGDSDAASRFA